MSHYSLHKEEQRTKQPLVTNICMTQTVMNFVIKAKQAKKVGIWSIKRMMSKNKKSAVLRVID